MNESIIIRIDALAHDGRGIARVRIADAQAEGQPCDNSENGRGIVIFVPNALPGQLVRVLPVRRKARLVEAQLLEVLQPAPDAVAALCPHQSQCGGCPLQTMPYAAQLHWKERLALDALRRIGRMPDAHFDALHAAPFLRGFRNKMEFAFGLDASGNLVLGLRRRGGLEVGAVPGCVIAPDGCMDMVALARAVAARTGHAAYQPPPDSRHAVRAGRNGRGGRDAGGTSGNTPDCGFWRFLLIRQGRIANDAAVRWWALCITSPGSAAEQADVRQLGRELAKAFPALAGFIHEERGRLDGLAQGERRVCVLNGQGEDDPEAAVMYLPLADRLFALDAASFFQVNTEAAQLLAATAVDMLSRANDVANSEDLATLPDSVDSAPMRPRGSLLDLYCGVGAPGLALAHLFSRVVGLERDPRAVALARQNAAEFTHCCYEAGDAGQLLRHFGTKGGQAGQNAGQRAGTAGDQRNSKAVGKKIGSRVNMPADTRAPMPVGMPAALYAGPWDTILIDPPRLGVSPEAMTAIVRLKPRHILYISCNPATLARDATLLQPHYALIALAGVDLFPHSPHLECVSLWRRT